MLTSALRIGLWIAAIVLAINMARLYSLVQTNPRAATLGVLNIPELPTGLPTPYTVVLDEIVTGPKLSAPLNASSQTLGVTSTGDTVDRFEYLRPNKDGQRVLQRTMEFADGRRTSVDDLAETGFAASGTAGATLSRLPDPRRNCIASLAGTALISSKEEFKGIETVGGFRAARIEKGFVTEWLALDHGCAEVRQVAKFNDGGTSVKTVTTLTDGEPDPSLFSVPTRYGEVLPSVLFRSRMGEAAVGFDSWYRSHKLPLHPEVRVQK